MGEQHGEMLKGFDYGNSPYQVSNIDFTGKTVIHISTAGTKGMSNAVNATEIITGSFVNASAIIKYINNHNPEIVSLVCTGTENENIRDEDALCAEYIKNGLEGKPNDFNEIKNHIETGGYIDRFLDPTLPKYPIEDISCCLALDKFSFVIKATLSDINGLLLLSRVNL
jgi:2-phosphosulfolactate phosphatase